MVTQLALLVAVHAQPVAAVTVTVPVPAADVRLAEAGEIVGAHGRLNENVFDRKLGAVPPGPTADTSVSYTTPGVRAVVNNETKSTRIIPSVWGVGFPRLTVCRDVAAPATKTCRE
jgi:hypothetical protein